MAGSLNARDDSDELDVNHEINVTPFIDVMLVLLIIFMVAAPLSTVDVAVDLPASNAQPTPRPNEPIFVTVKSDLTLAFGNDPVTRTALKSALDTRTSGNTDERIYVRADKTVDFGDLMEVMNELRAAGYLKIGLVGLEALPGAAPAPTNPAAAAAGSNPLSVSTPTPASEAPAAPASQATPASVPASAPASDSP
ncbi:TonB system transport protein ExbD [Hyphomicrobium sulfonivorans]|uniref:TonB system transport protein ExbD n=1 Tax=Hyphomicrobium sulfonivorans TaxID=121290 RepID=UPI00156D8184|nr:TonB system transport protein ExbD [Hyphomicrobium sulfonivorans]MBI1648827.1 TonB system transport protein ExbD [Hyphomicrobium sulfonivorans]NSL70638.1 TonB system transport protein ExbD [Hyphomicrobium sulfonivorans]